MRKSRVIGIIMIVIAAAFTAFALQHPESSFPWSNTITYIIYGLYLIATVILLVAPLERKE